MALVAERPRTLPIADAVAPTAEAVTPTRSEAAVPSPENREVETGAEGVVACIFGTAVLKPVAVAGGFGTTGTMSGEENAGAPMPTTLVGGLGTAGSASGNVGYKIGCPGGAKETGLTAENCCTGICHDDED